MGKRLPTSWEWQLAAQGLDGRTYPWGDQPDDGTRCPKLETRVNICPGPADVDAYPGGVSPHGVLDMVGNVWQYTDAFEDEHSKAVVLRGGSNYYPSVPGGVNWYFPNGPDMRTLAVHGKYLLMSDSFERAGTIGFRCERGEGV